LPKDEKVQKKIKKACCPQAFSLFNAFKMIVFLVLNDGIVRASTSAGAATNALIGINDIDATFGNSAHRAFIDASAASDAFVCNFVSHNVFNFNW
jgi:hypothetical protein